MIQTLAPEKNGGVEVVEDQGSFHTLLTKYKISFFNHLKLLSFYHHQWLYSSKVAKNLIKNLKINQ